MGWHMAAHMSKLPGTRCLVWNRDGDKAVPIITIMCITTIIISAYTYTDIAQSRGEAQRHAAEHGSMAVETAAGLAKAKVLKINKQTNINPINT